MRRSAGFKDILIDLIEDHQDEISALDPEYLEGGSARAGKKYEALHSGDLSLAMSLTSNYKLMTIFQDIEEEIKKLSSRRSASQIINNLERRVARLEKSASVKFKIESYSGEFKTQDVDLKGLHSIIAGRPYQVSVSRKGKVVLTVSIYSLNGDVNYMEIYIKEPALYAAALAEAHERRVIGVDIL